MDKAQQAATEAAMNQALDRLWNQFHPQMLERVSTLEAANQALSVNRLSRNQQGDANSAAHKLAGVLGTFGLTKGTVLAREAELLYAGDAETDPDSLPRLQQITEELKAIVANHK
jgi:HPt (histidine-containing phosphotransfer) domain-containing protein